jgi:hypothetical protein
LRNKDVLYVTTAKTKHGQNTFEHFSAHLINEIYTVNFHKKYNDPNSNLNLSLTDDPSESNGLSFKQILKKIIETINENFSKLIIFFPKFNTHFCKYARISKSKKKNDS